MGELLNDRYELVSPLGRGGMATVWRALDRHLGREVAVKLLDHRLCGDAESIARLHIEAQALARLSHPHIAAVHDFGTTDETGYLVMELVHGRPLTEIGANLPWPAVAGLVSQIADALASAHKLGIVHRDVTAANVLLTTQGAKLIDFGICALSGDNDTAHDGRMMGTTAYLAPERLDGEQVGPAVDVYALGVLMYLMLTGDLPDRPGPRDLEVPGLPTSIGAICSRCLQELPWRRPTAEQVADVLKTFSVPTKEMWRPALDRAALAAPAPLLTFTGPTEVKELRRQHKSRPPRRRGYAVGAAALVGAFAFLVWQVTNWTPAASGPQETLGPGAETQATAPAGSVGCRVTYQITDSGDGRSSAAITVTNIDETALDAGWQLRFTLPGGPAVVSPSTSDPLAPGQSATLSPVSQTDSYRAGDPLPTDFQIDERPCAATVVTPGGTPIELPASRGGGQGVPQPGSNGNGNDDNDNGNSNSSTNSSTNNGVGRTGSRGKGSSAGQTQPTKDD